MDYLKQWLSNWGPGPPGVCKPVLGGVMNIVKMQISNSKFPTEHLGLQDLNISINYVIEDF